MSTTTTTEADPGPPGALLAELGRVQAGSLLPGVRRADPPTWTDPGRAIEIAHELGDYAGRRPGIDGASHLGIGKIPLPFQQAVYAAATAPLQDLATEGERVLAASDEELGRVRPSYPRVKPALLLVASILGVVVVSGVIEYYIGEQQWERVLGSQPVVAARIALGVTVMIGVLSWMGSTAWFHRRPGVVREHGTRLFFGAGVLVLLFAGAMAYSFAGGVEAPTTGGITGGTSADDIATQPDEGIEIVRWMIYVLVAALYGWTVVVAHLWYSTTVDRRRVAAHVPVRLAAARASTTDPAGLLRLRATALRAVVDTWHQGVARAVEICTAFYSGARSSLAPSLLSTWDHGSVSEPTFSEPAWLTRIERTAIDLETAAGSLTSSSSEPAVRSANEVQ